MKQTQYGDYTIRVTIGFNAATSKMKPRQAKESGWLWIKTNEWHGIKRENQKRQHNFNSLADVPRVLNDLLIAHGVKLLPSKKTQQLFKV